jgi:hypothetical protein
MEDAWQIMKNPTLPALLLLGAAFAADEPAQPAAAAEAPKEFVLFNGKSLDDWESVDVGGSGSWKWKAG